MFSSVGRAARCAARPALHVSTHRTRTSDEEKLTKGAPRCPRGPRAPGGAGVVVLVLSEFKHQTEMGTEELRLSLYS